jgi:hypothetical protein
LPRSWSNEQSVEPQKKGSHTAEPARSGSAQKHDPAIAITSSPTPTADHGVEGSRRVHPHALGSRRRRASIHTCTHSQPHHTATHHTHTSHHDICVSFHARALTPLSTPRIYTAYSHMPRAPLSPHFCSLAAASASSLAPASPPPPVLSLRSSSSSCAMLSVASATGASSLRRHSSASILPSNSCVVLRS